MGGLAAQLRREVAQQIKTAWESSFEGRISVGQKALRPIRSALEKAKGLMFLDGGLGPIIESVEKTLSGLPRTGELQGRDFAAVCGAIHILSGIPEARRIQLNPPVEEKEEIVPPPQNLWVKITATAEQLTDNAHYVESCMREVFRCRIEMFKSLSVLVLPRIQWRG